MLNYILFLAGENDNTLGDAGNLIVSLVVIGLIGFATYLLIVSILKSRNKRETIDNELIDGVCSRKDLVQAMADFVVKYRRNNEFTLMYIEIQNIANLKEIFGVRQFDRFKQIMITNLRSVLPRNALLCQFNPNEYMILLRGIISQDKTESFANRVLDAIAMPINVGNQADGEITLQALMGIVIYPLNGINEKELFNNAEIALYKSKKEGTDRYTIFTDELNKTEQTNIAYYREIKEAIRKKEFTFFYHPIIDVKNNTVFGVEAFIRWNHPVLGVLPPNKFLTIMEHSGDISWVGRWGIEELCKQLNEWNKVMPGIEFKVSVNLSPKQLMDEKISEDFLAIVKANHVQPSSISLEIVEFAMFEKFGIVAQNIEKLSKLGFSMAIDDFGVEANTLAKLSTLPIKIVKLDRKFVENTKDNFIITKIVNMLVEVAANENLSLVAEGVEDLEILNFVKGFNIFNCQGYVFTKPLNASDMTSYLKEEKWKEVTSQKANLRPIGEEEKVEETEILPTPEE
ncbi:MAG: GGDEF domain-containing phosphodiesterase [Bacillales bacterium]|jgi:diguanylate cyclase (GGDEF)-like protein|nr:GGDEF domain-containing phosphodiesterase [Bacillales bacterium]